MSVVVRTATYVMHDAQPCNLAFVRSLDGKLEKRRAELERAEKRLSSLAVVRPAYMDEYEVLQAELQQLFATYLERFR